MDSNTGNSDGLPGSDELMASAHALASAINVGATLDRFDLGNVDPVATAAAIEVSVPEDIPVESVPPRPTVDSRLLGFVSVVAEADDKVRDVLLGMFPSYDELVGHAHLKADQFVRTEALKMLPSFSVRNRFTAVLAYIEHGGAWRDGLTLSDTIVCRSCAATESPPMHVATAHHSPRRKQDLPVPAARPRPPRIEGGADWTVAEGALGGHQVQLDRTETSFAGGERDRIMKILSLKLGAQLNKNGPPQVRKSKGGHVSGLKETYFLLRCKGYADHKCKFQVEVSATLEEERKYACILFTCRCSIY